MQQKFSLSDPVLIRQFSKQLESDPAKIAFSPDPVQSSPDPSSSLIAPPSFFTLLQRRSDSSFFESDSSPGPRGKNPDPNLVVVVV